MCQVTPNDGIADGATVNSSALQIVPLTVSDTYTGAFTEAGNMTVAGTGNLSLSSSNIIVAGPVKVNGTFIGGTGNHSFGSVTINSGGTYSATSALTTVKGSWNSTGGTFLNNSGTVRFTGLSANAILDGSSQFNRVEFNDSSAFSITAYKFDAINMLLANGTLYTRAVNDCDIGSSQMNYTQTGGTLFDPIGAYVCMLNVYLSGGTLDPNWLSYWGNFTITGGDTGTGGAWQARGTNNALQYFNTTLPINAYFYINGNNTLKLLSNVTLVGSNIFLQYSNSNVFDLNGYTIATPSGYVMVDQYYGGGNKQQVLTPNGSAIIVPLLAIGYGYSGVGTSIVGTPNANWTLKVSNVTVDGLSGGTLYLPNSNGFVNVTDTVTVRNANGVLNGSANGNYYFGTLNISSGGLYVATTGLTQINGPAYVAGNYSAGVSTTKISTASSGLRIQNGGNISIIGTSGNYATMTRRDADSGNWQLTVESGAITNFTYVNMSYVNATWNASSTMTSVQIWNAGDWTVYAGNVLKLVNSIFRQLPGALFKIFGTLILDATDAIFGNLNLTQTGNLTMLPGANVTVQNSFYCYNQTTLTNDTTVYGNLVAYSGCNITISDGKTLTVNGTTTINSGAVIGSNSAYSLDLTSITINAGGILNAPNATGAFNLSGNLINYGTFNPDSGIVITDSKSTDTDQYIEGNIKFFNLIVNSYWTTNLGTTSGAQTIIVENNLNVTSTKTLSINSGNGPVTVILGNSTQVGLLYNSGIINLNGNTAAASTLRGNSSAYLGVVSGNDLNWDGGGSGSKVNVSFLDYQIDATTGGAGVAINFNGDMTIDSFAISAGDTLNVTSGVTVTGNSLKAIQVYGTLNSDSAKWNGYRWLGFYGNSAGSIKNSNLTSAGQGDNAIIFGYTSGTVNVVFDNNTVSGNGFGAIRVASPTNNILITNSTLADGDHSTYYKYAVCVDNNAKLEADNSTIPTVALTGGTGGWLISKNHNKVSGEWRIYGILSSESADSGYRAADITGNLTILNADAYSTAFNTSYALGANALNIKNTNITTSTTLDANSYSLTAINIYDYGTFFGRNAGLVSSGTVTIYSGALFNATSGVTNITNGDFINYGTFLHNSGTAEIANTSYFIGFGSANPLNKLTIDASKNVSHMSDGFVANSDVTVNGLLDSKQNALNFVNNYVNISDSASLKPASITVEAWVNPKTLPQWSAVLMKVTDNTWSDGYGLAHYDDSSNSINFFVNGYLSGNASGTIPSNQWSHVVGTYDGQAVKIYINGQLVSSRTYSTAISHSTNAFRIGAGASTGGAPGYYWNGTIDEVRVYNRSLSASEISEHYRNIYSNETGLVGKWRFSESYGTTTADESGLGNNGNLINSPAWVLPNVTAGTLTINSGGNYKATSGTSLINGAALVSGGGVYCAGPGSVFKISTAGTGLKIQNTGNISVVGASDNYANMTRRDSDSGNWQLTVESGANTNFTYVNMLYLNATWNASSTLTNVQVLSAGDWTIYANIIVKFVNSIFQQIAGAAFKIFGTLILQSTNAVFGNLNLTNTGNLTMLPGANVTVQNNFYCANITTLTNTTYVGGNLTADTGCNITVASGYSLTVAGIVTVNSGATINGGNANNNFGSLTINSGGVYNATTGVTTINGGGGIYYSPGSALYNAGTLNHNNGTFVFAGTAHVTIDSAPPFYNLNISDTGYIYAGTNITVANNFVLNGGEFISRSGYFNNLTVNGNATVSSTLGPSLIDNEVYHFGVTKIIGTTTVTSAGSINGRFGTPKILNMTGTIANSGAINVRNDTAYVYGAYSGTGNVTLTTGTFNTTNQVTVSAGGRFGNSTSSAWTGNLLRGLNVLGTFDAPNANGYLAVRNSNAYDLGLSTTGTYNHNGGTIVVGFDADNSINPGANKFYNVIMDGTSTANYMYTSNWQIENNITINGGKSLMTGISATLTLGNNSQSGKMVNNGNYYCGSARTNIYAASSAYPYNWTGTAPTVSGAWSDYGTNLHVKDGYILATVTVAGDNRSIITEGNMTFNGVTVNAPSNSSYYDIFNVTTGTTTVNGTTSINGTFDATTGSIDANGDVTINTNGVLNAPNSAGTFTFSGTWFNFIGGTFNHDSGTVTNDGGGYLIGSGSTISPTFYNVVLTGTGWPALLYGGKNCTVQRNITASNAYLSYAGGSWASTLTLGTASAAGQIIASNAVRPGYGATSTIYVYAANSAYPFTVTGTDLDWDNGATGGIVRLKWGDVQVDATTGGGGVTVAFDGNMTIDAFTVSASDVLNTTLPGEVITGNSAKATLVYGTLNSIGNSTSRVIWTGQNYMQARGGGTINMAYTTINANSANEAFYFGQWGGGDSVTTTRFDNIIINNTNAGAIAVVSTTTPTITNCSLYGYGAGANAQTITIQNSYSLQANNCTYSTLGFIGPTGWFVSKNHNGIVNNWRIFGIVNSSVPSSGYKGSDWTNTTNVTIANADAYSTAFNSAFTQDENVNPLQLNVTTNTNYNINAGKNLTFPDSVGAGLASGARGTMTVPGTSANKVYIKSASGNPTNKWTGARAMNLYIDNAVVENFDSFGIGEVYNGGFVNLTNILLQNYTGYGFLFYGNAPNYYVTKFENVTVKNGGAVGVFLGRCGAGCDWLGVNVTIDNTPPYTVQSGGYLDQDIVTFENSTFNESKVSPPYGTTTSNATFILKNHNGTLNNYEVVFAGLTPNLYYSTLYKNFSASDNVTLMSSAVTPVTLGTLYINQSANATKFVINPNTMVDVTTGSTVITTALVQLNGSLRIDSGTWFNLTLNDIANTTQILQANSVQVFNVITEPADPTGRMNISRYVNLTNFSIGSNALLNITYSDSDLSPYNITDTTLRIWRNNGTNWSEVPGSSVNNVTKVITANITSFSVFAPMGGARPFAPVLLYPINSTTITSTTPTLNFTIPKDPDKDNLHFIVELYNDTNLTQKLYFGNSSASTTGFSPMPPVPQGSGNMSYTNGTQLAVDHTYWWRARALDTAGNYGPWSSIGNFTIISFVSCDFSKSSIDFISISPGVYDNNASGDYAGSGSSTWYNVTSSGNVNTTVQSKGTNLSCIAGGCSGYIIPASYTSWNSSMISNTSISLPGFNLTEAYDTSNQIATNLTAGSAVWLRYWIDIPDTGQPTGSYQGNYSIRCIAS
jgi:hypothetical protein